jgi:peptidoglycan/LPS O-acetylase OafA/YrhL
MSEAVARVDSTPEFRPRLDWERALRAHGRCNVHNAGMTNPATARSARVDFLRGVSIFLVLLLHFSLTYNLVNSPLALIFPARWIRALVINGNYGVTIFFVISGFLITSNNLLRYGRLADVGLRQFYAFRFARIAPALLLALAVILFLGLLNVPSFTNSRNGQSMPPEFFFVAIFSVLTFWHNVLMQAVGYFNYCLNIYWSLSVEEVFYLTFPIACVVLKRDRFIVALCLAAIIIGPAYRSAHSDNEIYFMYAYPACFDAIAFGCLTALLHRKIVIGRRWGFAVRLIAGIGLSVTYLSGIDGHEAFGFSLIALCAAGLLTNAFDGSPKPQSGGAHRIGRIAAGFRWAMRGCAWIVGWFGRHSYELYLFHIILLAGLRDLVPKATLSYEFKLPLLLLFLLASGLLAGAVARYFADPVNARLRMRLARIA